MNNEKTLTLNGLTIPNFIFVLLGVAMVFTGTYLTNHFFDTHYPTTIASPSSLCNINDFWGCDKATQSAFAKILGMPTSVFGLIIGLICILTGFVGNKDFEKTTKTILAINLAGSIALFIISLVTLGGLCPMCTLYYVLSAAAFFMLFKYSNLPFGFDVKVSLIFGLLFLIPLAGFNFYLGKKDQEKSLLAQSYIQQFNDLKDYGDPAFESPYKIHMATSDFASAPIRITIFSDFECPFCQRVAEQVPNIIKDFKEQANIQYMFYPLDQSCNKSMQGGLHVHACNAAYLAACDKNKFAEVHDYIFEHQAQISRENLNAWAKKFKLEASCFENKEVMDQIQQTLNAGTQFNLRSTPTIIINGRKLEGLVPYIHLKSILESLLK